ncbi:hypothetical protein [Exiguobacterium sp. R-17]|uniref:hypothetical protein n=1 Tax=Exiguobacterium sp. R-17 TaxID=3404054 RepID=UPI003CF48B38
MASESKERFGVTLTSDQITSMIAVARSFKKTREKAQEVPLFVTNIQGEIDTVVVGYHQFEEMNEIIVRQAALIEELEILSRLCDVDTSVETIIDTDDFDSLMPTSMYQ